LLHIEVGWTGKLQIAAIRQHQPEAGSAALVPVRIPGCRFGRELRYPAVLLRRPRSEFREAGQGAAGRISGNDDGSTRAGNEKYRKRISRRR